MKNRLEIAREFLRDDGVIFVQCDDNEQAYLKVLMDEIFGRENFVGCCPVCVNPKGRQSDKYFPTTHDYLISYAKFTNNFVLRGVELTDKQKLEYNKKDDLGIYREQGLRLRGGRATAEESPTLHFPIYYDLKTDEISLEYHLNFIKIIPKFSNGELGTWRWSKEKILKDKHLLKVRKVSGDRFDVFEKDYLTDNKKIKQKTLWLDKEFSNEKGGLHIKSLFNNKIFSYPKSEFLLRRIIEISTQPNDIVMDFFLGSGTTAAVAHKMNRQYIGIEQMDYIESVSVERLKKVIEGEQGGISKAINWQGGGEFIYFELAKFNQNFIDKISDAKAKDILNIYDEIYEKAFLNYDADSKILKDKKDDFKELNLAEQKEFLINILNKNMLYVNLDDIEDENYEISQKDKELNKDFYNE